MEVSLHQLSDYDKNSNPKNRSIPLLVGNLARPIVFRLTQGNTSIFFGGSSDDKVSPFKRFQNVSKNIRINVTLYYSVPVF